MEKETKRFRVRVTFTGEVCVKGESLAEIREDFEGISLFSPVALEHGAECMMVDGIEGVSTGKDYEWSDELDPDDRYVRVIFRSELYLEGEDIVDVRRQWENLPPVLSKIALDEYDGDFIHILFVEDAESDLEIDREWETAAMVSMVDGNLDNYTLLKLANNDLIIR